MSEKINTIKKIPKEEAVEQIFEKILSSPIACEKLSDVFYEHISMDNLTIDENSQRFTNILFSSYKTGDISGLLLELCQRSMLDLLREAYLIPKRFHGKAGKNPALLTDADGMLLKNIKSDISHHEFSKFQEIQKQHTLAPRSKLFLADGYGIERTYTDNMEIDEKLANGKRGILILYALPDTAALGLKEAEAYAIIWDTFQEIQKCAPTAMVYYGQETGLKNEQKYDELGVLLPIHQFKNHMLHHLECIDGIVLSCRENMFKNSSCTIPEGFIS